MKTCACGAAISQRAKRCKRCRCREAQARYERTEKGRRTLTKYRRTEKGRASNKRINERRIFSGNTYYGHAATRDMAAQINAHIKERVSEFVTRQQAGAHLEGGTPRTVRASAADRTDQLGGRNPHPRDRRDEGGQGDGAAS